MKTIKGFTQQHQELLSIVSKLSGRLSEKEVASDPKGARSLLSQLAGKLTIHLAMEDQHLYPFLMSHPKQELKELSQRFSQEMGGILSAFKTYKSRWPTHMEIAESPNDFIRETRDIFQIIERRIYKEDNELYPLVET